MRYVIIGFIGLLELLGFECVAQKFKEGESASAIEFREMANYKSSHARVSDFAGKPLLIDLWATWCAPCIAGLPTLHELQSKFGEQIQIVLLNAGEEKSTVQRFIEKRKGTEKSRITLPVVFSDSVVSKADLKNQAIPALYWIDAKGRVAYITSKNEVSERNVRSFIERGTILIPGKSSDPGKQGETNLLCTSRLEVSDEHRAPSMRLFPFRDSTASIQCLSCTTLDLFRLANGDLEVTPVYQRIVPFPISRTIVEDGTKKQLGKHMFDFNSEADVFNYKLTCANGTAPEKMIAIMKGDIERWFNMTADRAVRSATYLSLQSFDTTKISFKAGDMIYRVNDLEIHLNKVGLNSFLENQENEISIGRYFFPPYPIIDQTGYHGLLGDIKLEGDMRDYRSLDRALRPYGMQLKQLTGPIEILVVGKCASF